MAKDSRTRNFVTVVYPESAPDNWMSMLAEQCVPAFISPLHDQDINPTGEPKKAHYHVMIMFDGVKTSEQAREVFDQINGVGCEKVKSLRSYARYLCHLDNPDKHQYPVTDVRQIAGSDYMEVIGLVIDKYAAIGEMIDFCEINHITSYAVLIKWCKDNKHEWFRVLCDSATLVMREYLKSLKWTIDEGISCEEKDSIVDFPECYDKLDQEGR